MTVKSIKYATKIVALSKVELTGKLVDVEGDGWEVGGSYLEGYLTQLAGQHVHVTIESFPQHDSRLLANSTNDAL